MRFPALFLLCLHSCVFSVSAGEPYASKEFGFLAIFPTKPESVEMSNTLGPISTFMSFDETKELIYQITAHKILSYSRLPKLTDEENMEIVKTNFDGYIKEGSPRNTKSDWSKLAGWPTIEFSCTRDGMFRDGVTSYQRGFHFMQRGTFFTVSVHGFDPTKDIQQDALAFFGSFSFADAEVLNAAEQDESLKP
jgi:hypothetical protein